MFGRKRQIEEKTEDWQKEQARRTEEYEDRKVNIAKAEEEARAAEPERIEKLRAADIKNHAGWTFSCKVNAGFLVLRWTVDGEIHAHALAMKSVVDIKMRSGQPVRTTGTFVEVSGRRWGYVRPFNRFNMWDRHSDLLRETFSSPAEPASIIFSGIGFAIDCIPHLKADEAYQAIMSAIEDAAQ